MKSFWTRLVLIIASSAMFAITGLWHGQLVNTIVTIASLTLFLIALHDVRGLPALALGMVWGLTAFGIGVSWLWNIFHAFTIVLFAILACFPALFAWMQGAAASRGIAGWRWVLFTMLNWCGLDFIRAEVFTLKFPWMTLGLACGPNALLPWIGVYGVSAIVVAGAAVILTGRMKGLAVVVAVIVIALAVAGFAKRAPLDKQNTLSVAALQFEEDTTAHYIQQTEALPVDVRHVVWPEYAVPVDVRRDRRTMAALIDLCRKRNSTLTFGTQTNHYSPLGWFNTALTIDETGVLGEHHKVHPVHFFNDGTRGTTALPVKTKRGLIGTPICFDCDYEGVVRSMTAAGAMAFVVPTMDAASWSKLQHEQHAELFRIRAAENGRWILVAASSGVSQLINEHGGVEKKLGALTEGALVGDLHLKSDLTFYTRWGWLTPWCLLVAAGGCWIALLLPRRAVRDAAT